MKKTSIAVYCGARLGNEPKWANAMNSLGEAIAQSGRRLVYGGGSSGLMGVVADAALNAGGDVVGVIPHNMRERELAHKGLTEIHFVDTMHERKMLMADLSDAFIAAPGGFGTLDETLEVLTWSQIGVHKTDGGKKAVGWYNVTGYWDAMLSQSQHGADCGFIDQHWIDAMCVSDDAHTLLDLLDQTTLPPTRREMRGD